MLVVACVQNAGAKVTSFKSLSAKPTGTALFYYPNSLFYILNHHLYNRGSNLTQYFDKILYMKNIITKTKEVMASYSEEYPEINVDRDYYPLKLTEEWGECMQTYLMLTDRGRQKDKNKDEIKDMFKNELADVFGFLILFAENEGVDLEEVIEKKWFKRLNK
jgi:NTP pyrophosphatase (non-canonical NTP hydrolase)